MTQKFCSLLVLPFVLILVDSINMHLFRWKTVKFKLYIATGCMNMQLFCQQSTNLVTFHKLHPKYANFFDVFLRVICKNGQN